MSVLIRWSRPLFSKPLCWYPVNHNARSKPWLNKPLFTVVEADCFTVEAMPDLRVDGLHPESNDIAWRRSLRSLSAVTSDQEVNAHEIIASVLKAREAFHESEDLAELLGCQPDEINHHSVSVPQGPIPEIHRR
jgi:hypothetical protein